MNIESRLKESMSMILEETVETSQQEASLILFSSITVLSLILLGGWCGVRGPIKRLKPSQVHQLNSNWEPSGSK